MSIWARVQPSTSLAGPNSFQPRNSFLRNVVRLIRLGHWRRDVPAHMRYMICIVLVLLPAGLAKTMGYWFGARQSLSQTLCLILIDALLLTLIALDRRHHSSARLYISVLLAYAAIEAFWFSLAPI